jgi:DNA-binding XRE family transcriptional regulator
MEGPCAEVRFLMEVGGFKTSEEYGAWLRVPLDDWDEPDWIEIAQRETDCFEEDADPNILPAMQERADMYLQEKEDRLIRDYRGDVFIWVGLRVRSLRKAKGWTQRDLASRIGVGPTFISNVENGRKNLPLPSLKVLVRAFGMRFSRFLAGV